jgi:hypothetical protein
MSSPGKYDLNQLHQCLEDMGLPLIGLDRGIWGSYDEPDNRASDLVCLRPREPEDTFSKWVTEKAAHFFLNCCHHRIKRSRVSGIIGIKDKILFRLTYSITSIVASIIPSASIIILYCIESTWIRLGMLVVFNSLITLCLTTFTKASRSDVFTVSATYVYRQKGGSDYLTDHRFAAVLVVFIGTSA